MNKLKKIILASIITVTIPLAFMGCLPNQDPKQVASTFMDSLKQYNIAKPLGLMDTAEKNDNSKSSNGDLTKINFQDETTKNYLKALLKNLDYEIISQEKDGNSAKIKAKITSVDMDAVNKILMQQMKMQQTATKGKGAVTKPNVSKEQSAKQMQQAITKIMESKDVPKKTEEVTIQLTKVKSEWKIEPTDQLMTIIFGKMNNK